MTACASSGGQSGRLSPSGFGVSWKWANMIAIAESPSKGWCPVSISYATTPSEYWSDLPVMSLAAHCSGLMYDGVPTAMPVIVRPRFSATLAIPKSVTTDQPSSSIMMLAGLMSRCTIPCRWA